MKRRTVCALLLAVSLLFSSVCGAAEKTTTPPADTPDASLQDVQNEVQKAMNEMVSTMGTVMSGMAAGMQEGAESAQAQLDGADGTRLVSNKKDLAELLHVSVFKLEDKENNAWRVILAIRNSNDFPLRLVNLTRKQSVLLLDADGFAHDPVAQKDSPRTLTVASKAAVKAVFDFTGLESKPAVIRLFDTDFPIPQ